MYLVTTEADDDGTWWDDPLGFDSEREAREAAAKLGAAPEGYCRVLYRCDQVAVLEGGDPRTSQYGVAP